MRRKCWKGVWKSCHIRDKNVDRRIAFRYIRERNADRCIESPYIPDRNVDRRIESRNMGNIVLLLTLGTEGLFPSTELQSIQTGVYIMLLYSEKVSNLSF